MDILVLGTRLYGKDIFCLLTALAVDMLTMLVIASTAALGMCRYLVTC